MDYSAECTDRVSFIAAMIVAFNKKDNETRIRLMAMLEVSNQLLSAEARRLIKTSPQDDKHELSVEEFECLYPFCKDYFEQLAPNEQRFVSDFSDKFERYGDRTYVSNRQLSNRQLF